MKARSECVEILGKELVYSVEKQLKDKVINKETIDRVLDYLALHNQAFPYIGIAGVASRLCNNLTCSICYNGMKDSLKEVFRFKRYGYSTGEKIVLNSKPMRFVLPKKKFGVMLDALIRHELDHIATTEYIQLNREEYRKYLERMVDGFCGVLEMKIDGEKKGLIDNFISCRFSGFVKFEDGKKIYQDRDRFVLRQCGVGGIWRKIDLKNQFGSSAFNEGITAYKMKQLDKFASQGGVMCQSGYVLGEEVAKHFAEIIGEQKLIEMQVQNDFCGIIKEYKVKTGKTGKDIQNIFTILESKNHKSAFSKLFSQIKYGLTQRMDKNTQQKLDEIIKNESHVLEIE